MNIDKNFKEIFDIIDVESKTVSANTLDIPATQNANQVSIAQTTNVAPIKPPDASLDVDLFKDYNLVRTNYETIVNKGLDAIDQMLEIASGSQEPRAYEVVGQLIKSATDTNEKLILLQKQMREMTRTEKNGASTNIDKAIFIGSTADLNKMLKAKKGELDE